MTAQNANKYSIGLDYGTNSVRAVIVNIHNGETIGSSVYNYPSGDHGVLLDKRNHHLARQNPQDYIDGFVTSVKNAISQAQSVTGFNTNNIIGIGIDTTGSSPLPLNAEGIPLAMLPEFEDDLAAHVWLWKDHTSHVEAAEITKIAKQHQMPYLNKCGGTYSSEWFWAKIWHSARVAPKTFKAAYTWAEICDFIPAYITGNQHPQKMVRSICAAGHKAMFHEQWGGLPGKEFLYKLSPDLTGLRDRLYDKAYPSNKIAGLLTAEFAEQTGLQQGIPVAVGAFDVHHGAVGVGIKPGTLVKVIGTSTCDLIVAEPSPDLQDIPGICGMVLGSAMPDLIGIEAGQSAVGDIFNWFVSKLCPAEYSQNNAHANLTAAAGQLKPGQSGLLALDWNNGNRTILVDPRLSGLLIGQTLHTSAPEIYRALLEATAFGALTIINRIEEYGVKIEDVICTGGISKKNPLLMQIYADVCNRPMLANESEQACALGASIFGAVAAGAYNSTEQAQKHMAEHRSKKYHPNKNSVTVYEKIYKIYKDLHDVFGNQHKDIDLGYVMKELMELKNQ